MKRTIFVFILTALCFLAYAQNGVIRELSGTVELKAPGSSSFIPAKAGDRLSRDTIISTGFKSSALVEAGSAYITVRPLTRLTLTELEASAGAETINVNLQAGRVKVDVNPPAGTKTTMTVRSPIATASVRGTSFNFDTRNVDVQHGTVGFYGSRGKEMPVNAGSSGKIRNDGKAEDPIRTKNGKLRPLPPVGVDSSGGNGAESLNNSNGMFIFDLNYLYPNSDGATP